MADGGVVGILYRSGSPADALGRFELTVRPDGSARLDHRDVTGLRRWTARLERALWPQILDMLSRSGFPTITPASIPPGAARRELIVEPVGESVFAWNDTTEPAILDVFRILDALVRQVSGGAVRSTVDELPRVVHRRVSETERSESASIVSGAAAFGTIGRRPALAVVQDDITLSSLPDRTPLGPAIPVP